MAIAFETGGYAWREGDGWRAAFWIDGVLCDFGVMPCLGAVMRQGEK